MKLKHLLLAFTLLPLSAMAKGDDEFGVWTELGVEKSLTKKWDVGLDAEFRGQENLRWSIGASTSYKLSKHLKLGAFYSYINSSKPEKVKDKSIYDPSNPDYYTVGYNRFDSYWTNRHRLGIELTGDIKLWKWLKISARERYQFTHRAKQSIDKYSFRQEHGMDFDDNWNPIPVIYEPVESWDKKKIACHSDQVVRSRIKLEVDKKHMKFSPFISAEAHNSVRQGEHMLLQKVRTTVGTGYKINKQHSISAAYMLTFGINDIDEDETVRIHERMHTLNLGYNFKF